MKPLYRYRMWQYQRRVKRATENLHRVIATFPNRHEALFELQSILAHCSTDAELRDHQQFIGRQMITRTIQGSRL